MRTFTEEHRQKLSLARRGKVPWNKGKKGLQVAWNKERKGVMPEPWNKGLKGLQKAWNKGLTQKTSEAVARYTRAKTGKRRLDMVGNRHGFTSEKMAGEKHWKWKGGITPFNLAERARFRRTMSKKVFERDGYKCQLCGNTNEYLHADHIKSWSRYPELRFDLNNCRTLCKKCHYQITYYRPLLDENLEWGKNQKKRGGELL
jgi:hypothetical protein